MALITKIKTIYSEVVAALGFTPENPANKGVANGYAALDAGGRVPSAQLPSYVDDVLEYPNLASFPNPGAAGIIYLALDTNIIYRWGGSTYVDIASGDVAWADVTGKPAFGTLSLQDANSVNITGGTVNATSSIIGNLSLATNQITSTQASDDILITPTGIGALKVQNRITLEDTLSFGPLDPQGSYFANNAEYLQAGPLSAWSYLQNGTATKVEFDNGAAMTIANAASGNAGDFILGWTEVLNISSAGNVVTGNWTAGVIGSDYGGTGVDNGGNLLTITANASISGTNTGDQTITLTGDVTGSGTGSFGATLANSGVTAGTYGSDTQVPQITVDAKGRITGVTNITLPAISSTFDDNVFTIQDETDNTKKLQFQASNIAAGTTRILTAPNVNGTIITSADTGTVTNTMLAGSIADSKLNTISTAGKVSNSATTATSANTASAIVARDASGNFSAGTISANLNGIASTATMLTAGTSKFYTNILPGNTAATSTYVYVGRWTTTQTLEKLALKILYNNSATGDYTRSASEYIFYFFTSDGTQFTAGSAGNFYGWGRGFRLGGGGAIVPTNNLAVQVSNTQYDLYIYVAPTSAYIGTGTYTVQISSGTWTHSGTDIGTTAPSGNSLTLYIDSILTNYSDPTFYSISLLGQLNIDSVWDATDGVGAIAFNNATGNRIDFATTGIAVPSTTTRSVGTKIVFYPQVTASTVDYGIGISGNTLWYSVPDTARNHTFYTGTTVSYRISGSGASSRGAIYQGNSAISTQNTTVTLTIAQLLTLVIQTTPTANITFTLPTGTNTDAGVMSGLETFRSFTWSIVNTAAFTVTMAGNTGMTYVGNTTIAASSSASFRTIKTAANTFTTYRI